jgi:glycosyltransferase involved in cell wall biosynthesis
MTPRSPASRGLVIIPAYNEEDALPGVLEELRTRAPQLDVVVVDDGSRDHTAAVAAAGGAVVLELPFNLGIGGALRCGFKYAVECGYERAVQFDADGQHDADEIPALFAALDAGADMVVGSRFASDTGYEIGRTRQGAMGMLRLGVRLLSGRRFTDTSSGFRAFRRPVLEFFATTYPLDYMDSVEALILACRAGFDVIEVPANMRARSAGIPSHRSLKLAYHYLRLLIVMASSASLRAKVRPT